MRAIIYNESGTLSVDFINSICKVREDWVPGNGDAEVIPLHLNPKGLSDADYVSQVTSYTRTLEKLVQQGANWASQLTDDPVWFEWAAHESYSQRIAVLGGDLAVGTALGGQQLKNAGGTSATLTLVRQSGWLASNPRDALAGVVDDNGNTDLPSNTGGWLYGPTLVPFFNHEPAFLGIAGTQGHALLSGRGTLDGYPIIKLSTDDIDANFPDTKTIWLGIRSVSQYGVVDFRPFWNFNSSGTVEAGTITDDIAFDREGSLKTTFSATFTQQAVISGVSPLNGDSGDIRRFYGRYLLLLRYKTESDASTDRYAITLHYGGTEVAKATLAPASEWGVANLGVVSLPSRAFRKGMSFRDESTFDLYAELISQNTNGILRTDGLIAMPYEYWARIEGATWQGKDQYIQLEVSPDGQLLAFQFDTVASTVKSLPVYGNLRIPTTDSIMGLVMVQNNDFSSHEQGVSLSVQSVDRWTAWRGDEA